MRGAARRCAALLSAAGVAPLLAACHPALIRSGYGQTYFRADDNWLFRGRYPAVDRLFNGFDYGHAIVYERLIESSDASRHLDGADFDFVTKDLLVDPPRVPLVEHAIGPHYANLIPEVLATFEWAHLLHRQLYDICGDRRLSGRERDRRIAEALRYYASRPDLALSTTPKSMALMEGQPYSLSFRREAPRFNRLLWSYHWLQMALYDAMLDAATEAEQDANVTHVTARFWEMIRADDSAPPTVMPMSMAIAPTFSDKYPEAAIIFDNLHSLHDVVADILASPVISRDGKRAAALVAAAAYRDHVTDTTSVDDWAMMSSMMGIESMGGPAIARRNPP